MSWKGFFFCIFFFTKSPRLKRFIWDSSNSLFGLYKVDSAFHRRELKFPKFSNKKMGTSFGKKSGAWLPGLLQMQIPKSHLRRLWINSSGSPGNRHFRNMPRDSNTGGPIWKQHSPFQRMVLTTYWTTKQEKQHQEAICRLLDNYNSKNIFYRFSKGTLMIVGYKWVMARRYV